MLIEIEEGRENLLKRILELLKKQGGWKLIKQYAHSGSLISSLFIFLILGKSRTALEILRSAASLKAKQRLERKYRKSLLEFVSKNDKETSHDSSNKVWVCWFQGLENAPELVNRCFESLKKNLPSRDIVLITSENMEEYVIFPDYIIKKWRDGIITHTHMTDLLRLELLIKYGGTWIDSTVLCTCEEENIPSFYFDSDLFFFQDLKPGRDGHATVLSSWFISAHSNNIILLATRYLIYEYWKKNKYMLDYFLLHDFFQIVLEYYEEEWENVVPVSNASPHILLLRLFDTYDETLYKNIIQQVPFHKLSYKFSDEQKQMPNTFYKYLLSK